MKPEEKARELYYKFINVRCYDTRPIDLSSSQAKECALISVDEILEVVKFHSNSQPIYWNSVKEEIKKL